MCPPTDDKPWPAGFLLTFCDGGGQTAERVGRHQMTIPYGPETGSREQRKWVLRPGQRAEEPLENQLETTLRILRRNVWNGRLFRRHGYTARIFILAAFGIFQIFRVRKALGKSGLRYNLQAVGEKIATQLPTQIPLPSESKVCIVRSWHAPLRHRPATCPGTTEARSDNLSISTSEVSVAACVQPH